MTALKIVASTADASRPRPVLFRTNRRPVLPSVVTATPTSLVMTTAIALLLVMKHRGITSVKESQATWFSAATGLQWPARAAGGVALIADHARRPRAAGDTGEAGRAGQEKDMARTTIYFVSDTHGTS